jgi:AraC-like DNA-binding protein
VKTCGEGARSGQAAVHLAIRQARTAAFHALVSERPLVARVCTGVKRIEGPAGTVDFTAGSIGTLPPRLPLTISNVPPLHGPYLTEAMVLNEDIVAGLDIAPNPLPALRATHDTRVAAAFGRSAAALADPDCPERLRRHLVEELLLWLAEVGIGFGKLRPATLTDRLRAMISEAPGTDWHAKRAARALGVSEATMRRRLAETGTSFSGTLIDVRMAAALALLQSSAMSVTQVAFAAGYASPSRFAVRFRERFGLSPSELRGEDISEVVAPKPDRYARTGTAHERFGTDSGATRD